MQVEHLAYSSSVNLHCSLFPSPFSQHLLTREEGKGRLGPSERALDQESEMGFAEPALSFPGGISGVIVFPCASVSTSV